MSRMSSCVNSWKDYHYDREQYTQFAEIPTREVTRPGASTSHDPNWSGGRADNGLARAEGTKVAGVR